LHNVPAEEGGFVKFRNALLACAGLFVVAPAFAQDTGLAADAKAFGSREAVISPRLSPDGSSVMYLTPGPGPKTFAVISNLATGKTAVMTSADGNPELLRWCDYAAADRAVCLVTGAAERSGELLGFERLIALNTDGKDPKLLGQPESQFDAGLRQFDASVLDWGKRVDGKLLMEREYVPEAGKIGSNIVRTKSGLGVDLIDTRSLRADHVEQPKDAASGYISDGRGNVRIMQVNEAKSDGTLTGRIKYFYRTSDSRDWKTLVEFAYWQMQLQPLAVDAVIDALYALN
jgi:hypothetical protein